MAEKPELPIYQEGGSTPSAGGNNLTKPISGAPIEVAPVKVDYFGMKLVGNKDMNISRTAWENPAMNITLMPKAQAYEHYKPYAAQAGVPWNKATFGPMYDQVEQQYAAYQTGRWDEGINQPNYHRRHNGFYAQALAEVPLDTAPSSFNFFAEGDTRFALNKGTVTRTKTDQQFMDERGFYKPIVNEANQGSSVLNKMYQDYQVAQEEGGRGTREYVDVSIGGQNYRMGDLKHFLVDYENQSDITPGPGGNTVLKQGVDANGLPMWEEVDMHDEVHSAESVRSAWGPRKMYSEWSENLWDSMVLNTLAGTPTASMSAIDWMVDANQYATNPMGAFGKKDDLTDDADRYAMNWASWNEVKTPQDVLESNWNDNAQSFWWHGGGALGSIAQMLLSRGASTRALTKLGVGINSAMKTGAFIGSGVMALEAAGGFKRGMVEMGVPEEHQFALYLPSLIGSYAVERLGGNILDDGLKAFYAKKELKEYVKQSMGESMEQFGVSSINEMTKQQINSTGKRIWNGILNTSKSGAGVITKYAPTPLKAAVEEGMEEVIEGRLYSSMEVINDWYTNTYAQNGEDFDRYGFVAEKNNSGDDVFYRYDKVNGQRYQISGETYNKAVEGQKIKPGEGMIGEYNPNLGFTGNWNNRAWEGMDADFVMGAFAGGLMGTFQSVRGGQKQMQGKIVQEYAVRGETDVLKAEFAKMHADGTFGPKDISPNQKVVNPQDPENAKSLNDVGYELALQELEEANSYVKRMGITDPVLLKEMTQTESGMSLLKEGYDNVKKQVSIQSEIDEINKQISETTDKDYIATLQKDIQDKEIQKKDLTLQLNDIRDGSRFKEKMTNRMIQKFSRDNNLSMVAPDGSKFVPGIHEINNFNNRFDQAKQVAINTSKESTTKRAKLENEVSAMFSSAAVNTRTTEGMSQFFETLTDIQNKATDVGLSAKGAETLVNKLEGYRNEILANLDSYFSSEEVAQAKETSEAAGLDYKETLEAELPSAKAGTSAASAYEWSKNLESSINSISEKIDKPDVKAGDMVQWTSQDQSQFDTPRKLESISADGKYGKVEGSDVPIPIEQLHRPDFQGRAIRGKIAPSFNEDQFKQSFYNTYIDTQGNEIDITKTLEDLASRKMNDEDFRTLTMLDEAIKNNEYLADVNFNAIGPLMNDKTFDFGKYRPSNDSKLTPAQYKEISNSLEQKRYFLDAIKIKQQQDVNDKVNREGKIRLNDYQIRNDIVQMISSNREVSLESKNELVSLFADITDKINLSIEKYNTEKKYVRNDLDEIDPLLVRAESVIHKELNGENSKKLIASLGFTFRNYKEIPSTQKFGTYHEANEFVMHDFDSSFSFESFFQKIGSLANMSQADSAKTQFSRLYYQNHLQTLKRMDPIDFYNQFSAVLSDIEVEDGIIPSYEQIKIINHSVAFMLQPNNDVIMAIEDVLMGSKNKSITREFNFNRSLFIRGFAGTGKTSLVVKSAANIYSNILGRKINIDTSAPSRQLQKSLNSHLLSFRENADQAGMTFNELLAHIDRATSFKNTDLLVIDEASNLNKSQIDSLKEALTKAGAKNNMTIMFLGDQSQMTSVNQRENEHLAVERTMERTMPTTEVFRSGAADISNLQSAYRNSIFRNKEVVLPKGTFDNGKNNGLEYYNGTKRDLYDIFVKDLNGGDAFKRAHTALIVYTKSDREAALNYVQKKLDDPSVDLGEKIKTIEEGEFSAQGLEYGRVIVAIDQSDAKHLYNRAMLTAATRAMKIDDKHNGYAMVMSNNGYSEEGDPIIVETKTSSKEDVSRANSWIESITGRSYNTETKQKQAAATSINEVTPENYTGFKTMLRGMSATGKIEFSSAKFMINDVLYRYKIKNKGVQSVTERLSETIEKSSEENSEFTNSAHANRGSAIHKIVESYINKQQKKGGKLFTKKDIEDIRGFISSYNMEIDSWNDYAKSDSAKLVPIQLDTDELVFETNPFVKDVIDNVAAPLTKMLNQNGIYSLPESVIGIYYNDIAGTVDIIDVVGFEGGMPIVDIHDLKTLTPGSHRFFGDSNEESSIDLGVIRTLRNEVMPANKLNQALSQLGIYKAILERGDIEIGFAPVKVRNINIIKSMISGENAVSKLSDDDFVQYDSESQDFLKFKNFGNDIVDQGQIRSEKDRKEYVTENAMLGLNYESRSGSIDLVTGYFKTKQGEFVEINNDINNPIELGIFNKDYTAHSSEPVADPKTLTKERLYNSSALAFENGDSYAFGTASNFLQEGKTNLTNFHSQLKTQYLSSIANKLRPGSPSAPKFDLVFHPTFQLLTNDGKLTSFPNVLVAHVSDTSMPDLIKAARKTGESWASGSDEQVTKAIKDRGLDIIATMPNPDSTFGKTESMLDYTNEAEVGKLMKKIKAGFKKNGIDDTYKTELVNWHTHLAGLRAIGAKTPNEIISSVTVRSVSSGTVIYDGNERSFSDLRTKLIKKGFKIGNPYFDNRASVTTDENGAVTNIASWVVDVWKIDRNVDGSKIILRTGSFDEDHYKTLKASITSLKENKSANIGDVNKTDAFRFIQENRSFLIDPKTKKISSVLPQLDRFLRVKGAELELVISGKASMPKFIDALANTIDYLNTERIANNKIAKSLRKHSGFTTGDNGQLVIPRGSDGNLFTSASDVNHFGFNLNTKVIDTSSVTEVKNGTTQNTDGVDPDISRMGIINPDPNTDKDYMEELDENTFSYDAQPEADTESDFNKKSKYYSYAQKYFGDIRLMNSVKKDVARNIIFESNWNRRLDTPAVTVNEMIANTIDFYKRIAGKVSTKIDITSDEFHYTDLSQISGKTVHLLNPDQFGRYFNYILGTDTDALIAVVQKLFPSLDLRSMSVSNLGDAVSASIEGDTELKVVNENSQGNVMDNLEERSLTDTLSGFVHLHLNHMPLKTFSLDKNNEIVAVESQTAKVDPKTIHKSLVDAAQMSHWPDPESGLWSEDKIDRWHHNLENIALEAGIGTKTYDNIMTFIHTFFSEDPLYMSHKYIRDNSIARLGQKKSNLESSNAFDPEVVAIKGYASDNLLSALYSHFLSAASKKSVSLQTKGRGERKSFKQKTQSLAIGAHIAQNIQSRINNTMFSLNDGGLEVSEAVASQISGNSANFKVQQNGIIDVRFDKPKTLINFSLNKNRITEFSIPKDVTENEIKELLNVLSIKELIYGKTVRNYLATEEDKINKGEDKKDRAKLAEIVGMMLLTAKSSVEPGWSGESLVEAYYKENGYTRDSLEDLNDDVTLDASSAGQDLYKPTDLYRLFENIGKAQSDVQLQNHSRHYYNVQNKKINRDTNGSTVNLVFPSGDIGGKKPSSGVKSYFKALLETSTAEERQFNPLINDEGKVLNAIANPDSGWDIDDFYVADGIKTEYKGVRQGKNMTDLDFAEMMINGLFVEDVLKGRRIEKIKIPYHNIANKSSLPIFVHKFNDTPVFKKTEDGIEINKTWRDEQVLNQFEYYNNARLASYRKWASLLNEIGTTVTGDIVQGWMDDPNTFQAYMMEVQSKVKSFKDLIMRSDLVVQKDYQINKKGFVVAGNAPLMYVDNVYNMKNFNALKRSAPEKQSELIDKMFYHRNMNAASLLKEIGFKLHPKLEKSKLMYTTGKTSQGGNIWKVNPSLEAFLFAYHFADHNVTQLLQGDVNQYKNISDLFKRSTGPVAPRQVPDTSSPRGIGRVSRAIIIEDKVGTEYAQLQSIFGKGRSYDETDGLGLINPISYKLLRNSFGGEDLGVIGDGMIKPVYYKNDLSKNEAIYFKYALLPITQQTLENSPIARDTFRKMVGQELYGMWEAGQSIDELADYVIKNDLRDKITMQAIFTSGVKTGAHKIGRFEDPEWGNTVEVDNDYFGIQLNASQDVSRTDLSMPTQLLALMGIGEQNKERIGRINEIKSELAEDGMKEISSNFIKDGVFKKDMFFDYLREMGIQASTEQDDIGKYAEMLHDLEIDLNIPTVRTKLLQQLFNKITSKAIKPKWNGVRMSQAPGLFFRLYEDEGGNVFMESEVQKYGVKPTGERELQPMKFYKDPEFKQEITDRADFDSSPEVFVKPADIIMPFSYFEQFGLKKYVDANPSFSLNDVFMFKFSDGMTRNLRNVDEDQLADILNNEFTANRAADEAAETKVPKDTFLQQEFTSPDKALKFIIDFKETLRVIDNRIPSSSPSAAFIGNVVGWINDNGNTVYTSAAKNLLDGGDYDIDQLNVYFKSVDRNGKIIKDDSKQGKMNEMFDLVDGYYRDSKNAELYMSPISLENLRAEVSTIVGEMKQFVNDHNDFGSNLYYNDKISQGDNLIGVFANVIKNYSYLAHAVTINPNVVKKISINPTGINDVNQYVINVLESFMNAATDNAKELILGVIGATEDAGNLIGAAGIKGKTENEIVSLLLNEAVQDVFKKVKYSKRSDNAQYLKVLDAITNKINDLTENQVDARADIETKITELNMKLSGGEDSIQIDDIYEDENGMPHFLTPSDIRGIQNQMFNEWIGQRDAYVASLNNMGPTVQSELDALYELKDLAYLGEAISRMNTVTKLDSNGLPVFDYEIDKQVRDIEYNMGMTITDFLAGNSPGKDWFKSRKAYIQPDKMQEFMLEEKAIRDYIDIPAVIRTLPHIEAYVKTLNQSKQWMQESFLRNSKMVQDSVDQFLLEKKIDWFTSEQAYYSFYKELENFMISVYFGTEFKDRRFQSITGITKINNEIDISSPEGRYQFGMEFPRFIMDHIDSVNAAKTQTPEDKKLQDNYFMKMLTLISTPTGDFLEFRDSFKLTDEDYVDLRASFKTLPANLREKFYIYQLSKDGFSFTKGGLYEAMDNELFRRYSEFTEHLSDAASAYSLGNTYNFHLQDKSGRQVSITFEDMLNSTFLKDVGFYSDDMSLLRRYNKEWTEKSVPNQYKTKEKMGAFQIEMVVDNTTGEHMQGSTKKTFNPYNPLRSNMTSGQVLRKISFENYSKIKQKQNTTIKFNDSVSFKAGSQVFLPDGSLAEIKQKNKNSIMIGPSLKTDPMYVYKSEGRKRELLDLINNNSENDMHKAIAGFMLDNYDNSYMSQGKISYTNEETDADFKQAAADGRKVYGSWDSETRHIAINMSQVKDQDRLERAVLHEMLHDYTSGALDATAAPLASLGENARAALRFKADIGKIFAAAKVAASAQGKKFYGMKNEKEFVSEAFTNPQFQAFLGTVEAVGDLKTTEWYKSLWNSFVNAIKNLLGLNQPNTYTALDQVIGVTNRFIEDKGYDFKAVKQRGTNKYFMEEDTSPLKDVKETIDILSALQPSGVMKNYSQYKEEELVNSIYNNINSKSSSYFYNGEKFYFKKKDGSPMDELEAKAKIKNEVLPKFTEFEREYKNTVISWLNDGAAEDGGLPAKYFPRKGGGSRYNPMVLAEMKRRIDYDVNDVYMRYSELKNNPNYANLPFVEQFAGHDPIIVLHKSIDGKNESISIFDATSMRLGKKGILEGNMLKKFIGNDKNAFNLGVNLGNNEGDLRRLLIGLQAMAMKKANPDLKIKHIGVLGVNNKGVDATWVYMQEFLDNVRAIRSTEELYNAMSPEIKAVMEDESLFEDNYEQPWIFMLKRKLEEKLSDLNAIDGQEFNIKKTNDAIDQLEAYLNGEGSRGHTLEMMISRQQELEDRLSEDQLLQDREYQYLSNTIKELSTIVSFERNSTKDLDRIKASWSPSHNIDHEVVNWAQEKIMNGMNYVQEIVAEFQTKKFYPLLKDFNERYFVRHPEQRAMDYLQDLSGKKFMPLFKVRTVKDRAGNDVQINSAEIHFDMDDAETKAAINKAEITPKDVAFGKFIVDNIEAQMIKNLQHINRHNKKYTKADAETELAAKWKRGMIPVMSSSVNEMLMKKDPKSVMSAMRKFKEQLGNIDDIYDEVGKKKQRDTKRQKILKEMSDFFMYQIGKDSEDYGSEARMKLMGLSNELSGPVLNDAEANKNISTNLELIMLYMVSSSERKRHFDRQVLPFINSAQSMLHAADLARLEGDQTNAISYFTNYVNSTIKGVSETLDSKIGGIHVDPAINQAIAVASFNGLAWNLPVGVTSGMMNISQFMTNAMANDVAKEGMYGKKDMREAIQMWGTKSGRNKIEGIMEMYKLADRSERDLIHNPRRKVTNKNMFTSHAAHWFNWVTDYNVRGLVAAAQMIHDGSIAAYSMNSKGELVYDESKDPTWKSEDGKVLKKNMVDRLIEDGYMVTAQDKMPRGYDNRMARNLKWLSDKYIIGGMDDTTKTRMSRMTLGRPFMQFASYLPDKLGNYFGSKKYSPVAGKYKVAVNEAGQPETVWEKRMTEGIFVTFKNLWSELRKNNYKSMKKWSEMSSHEKRNVAKFSMDMIQATILFTLYAGLTQVDWDEEEKGKQTVFEDSRFLRVFKYAALDFLVWNPITFTETMSSIPSLEQAQRLAGIFVGDFSQVERSLPLSTSIRAIGELIPEDEETEE